MNRNTLDLASVSPMQRCLPVDIKRIFQVLKCMKCEVLTRFEVFWDVLRCRLVDGYQCFGRLVASIFRVEKWQYGGSRVV